MYDVSRKKTVFKGPFIFQPILGAGGCEPVGTGLDYGMKLGYNFYSPSLFSPRLHPDSLTYTVWIILIYQNYGPIVSLFVVEFPFIVRFSKLQLDLP